MWIVTNCYQLLPSWTFKKLPFSRFFPSKRLCLDCSSFKAIWSLMLSRHALERKIFRFQEYFIFVAIPVPRKTVGPIQKNVDFFWGCQYQNSWGQTTSENHRNFKKFHNPSKFIKNNIGIPTMLRGKSPAL